MPTISEAEHRRLTEAERRVRATEVAGPIIDAELTPAYTGGLLAYPTVTRLSREAMRDLPLTAAGALDETRLRAQLKTAREAAIAEFSGYLNAETVSEAGRPRGLGASSVRESGAGAEFDRLFSHTNGA